MENDVIICSETISTLKQIPSESADVIFVDPPYWMRVEGVLYRNNGNEYGGCNDEWDNQFLTLGDYQNFTREWLVECKRILKKDGSFWVIGGMQCIYTIGAIMQELDFWIINDVIWAKKNPTPNFKGTRLTNSHETLIWAVKSKKARYTFNYKTAKELNGDAITSLEYGSGIRKQLGSVWRIGVCQGEERLKDDNGQKLHNTQKPEELLYRVLAISSKVDDVVLDPFAGTMTTGAVAKRMGRHFICIDSCKKYCEYGKKRIDKVTVNVGLMEQAYYDRKPPRVNIVDMINKKYFVAGEKLYYKKQPYFLITEDGKAYRENQTTDIHTAIALAKGGNASRLNGWEFWEVRRNGEYVNINDIRKKYLKEECNYE